MKTPRVLILTAGFGEGHNAAARALAAACDHLHGAGTAQVADLFAATSPRLNALSRWLYLAMINRTPRLWSAVYSWVDRSSMPPRLRGLLARERRLLAELIVSTEPVAIASTYPVYAFLHADLARTLTVNVPFYNVVTDSISINSLWWRAGGAGWFMPNEDSARVLRGVGLGDDQLHVCGFPVAPFFAEHAGKLAPPDLAAGATPRVLYIINSGTQHALETARRLLAEVDWDVTFAVGRDDVLRQRLLRLAEDRPRPAQILGWTHEIPRLLMTHHAVVSKAGGATTQEAIAACCPMIVNQIVPGQEEGNYELLRRHGAGALAETPAAVVAELRAAFAAGGGLWRRWRTALTALSRPDAARQIARTILTAAPALEPIPLPLRLSPVPA
jgi:processive 1,2-diacylglycerol beta-glucosyltransferase